MNTKLYILGAFALGVGCGSVGAYLYCQKKFDTELDEQTAELKQWAEREVERQLERERSEPFLSSEDEVSSMLEEKESGEFTKLRKKIVDKHISKSERINYSALSSVYRGEKPSLEDLANKLRAEHEYPSDDSFEDEDIEDRYKDCYRTINDDEEPVLHTCEGDWILDDDERGILLPKCLTCPFYEKEGEEANSDYEDPEHFAAPADKTGVLYDRGEVPKIQIISEEEYFDPAKTYDSEELTYYKQDDVLADEDDNVVDIEKFIGGDALEKFEDGTVYVRNNARKVDYEVIEEDKSYQQYVLGIDDEDDDPRGIRARFADREEEE